MHQNDKPSPRDPEVEAIFQNLIKVVEGDTATLLYTLAALIRDVRKLKAQMAKAAT